MFTPTVIEISRLSAHHNGSPVNRPVPGSAVAGQLRLAVESRAVSVSPASDSR